MGVSLYTSRVVLVVLGVEDFGIYGVVGGVVAMFSFLNSSMSGATSRFLTFEIGKNDFVKLSKTFSSALTIHIFIALFILLLGETVGLWFLESKLVIPDERMIAARWVFQFSLISAMISFIQVPYNASIISHERMNVYAYVEILNVFLKLGIVYLLSTGDFDKLILYAFLVLCISIITALIYRIYCLKHFEECKYIFNRDKKILYSMLSFSSWDLYGNLSVIARTQGVNILLNMFFGPLLNAANTVAIQVQGAVMAFASNIVTAVRPQIVKDYASGNIQHMTNLVMNASKYIYILLLVLSLPLILEMNFILNLWLKNVPDYAVIFCRFTLMFNFFATMSIVIVSAIHATGNIKRPSLINGSLYLLVIPVSYIAFKCKGTPEIPYICNVLFVFIGMLSNAYTLKLYIPQFSFRLFIVNVLSVCLLIACISSCISLLAKWNMQEGVARFMLVSLVSTISIFAMAYIMAVDKQTKKILKKGARKWINW